MSEITRWWWVRHAPVPPEVHGGRIYGAADVPCDCSDSEAFAGLARRLPSGAVWVVSSLARTRQTAAAIAAAGLDGPADPETVAAFAEQDFGGWQDRSWADLHAAADPAMVDFWRVPALTRAPGGESFADVIIRAAPAVEQLTARHAGRDVIAVAHGGTIRAVLAHALRLAPEQALAFRVDNLSVTRIDHIPGGSLGGRGPAWRVGAVNVPPDGGLD